MKTDAAVELIEQQGVYSLCEAVADLAGFFAVAKFVPQDSRETIHLCIKWAAEFEDTHSGREWDGEYMEAIEEFFSRKYTEWEVSNYNLRFNPNAR